MFIFDNTMKNCNVKINDNIFSKVNYFNQIGFMTLQNID